MYEHILVPLDGSARSEAVLTHLGPFLSAVEADLTVLVVVEYPHGQIQAFEALLADAEKDAWEYVERVCERLEKQGLRARGQVRVGVPAPNILEEVEACGADLVALASHGYCGVARLMHGSVTEQILRACPVTTLVVKSFIAGDTPADPYTELPLKPVAWKHILVPLDGSPDAERALDDATEIARVRGATVHLFRAGSVVPPGAFFSETMPVFPDLEAEAGYLRAVADRLKKAGVAVEPTFVTGLPVGAILDYLANHPVDLICMTTHGRSGLSRWVLGSVAESVLRNARVPILLRRTQPAPRGRSAAAGVAAAVA